MPKITFSFLLGILFNVFVTFAINYFIFTASLPGDVAQLARALDWQSRGRGFDSHLLHNRKKTQCDSNLRIIKSLYKSQEFLQKTIIRN